MGGHVVAGRRAEQPDRARDEGKVVGQHVLAQERLGHAGAEELGCLDHLVGGAVGALADQHHDLPALVEDCGGPVEVGLGRQHPGTRVPDARIHGAVLPGR